MDVGPKIQLQVSLILNLSLSMRNARFSQSNISKVEMIKYSHCSVLTADVKKMIDLIFFHNFKFLVAHAVYLNQVKKLFIE